MKKLITTLTLLLMFSSPSYAEWERVTKNTDGDTFYVDFDRIRKVDGFVYYWVLHDYLKPESNGNFSGKGYYQADCKLFGFKILSFSFHTQPMGNGKPRASLPYKSKESKKWINPPPNSGSETLLNAVCNR